MKFLPIFPALCCCWCLCVLVYRIQTLILSCRSMGLDTPRWFMLVWARLISYFWIEKCLGKFTYLVPIILSWFIWISCMAWIGTHIACAPWLFVCIFCCPQYVNLQDMCAYVLVIKLSERFELFITVVVRDGQPPVVAFVFYLFKIKNHMIFLSDVASLHWSEIKFLDFCV